MNIREHAKALYDNWFNNGKPASIFDGVIWPICDRVEKEEARLNGILCPIEDRDKWREKALMWRKYCRQANKGAMVNRLIARNALDGQSRWRKIAEAKTVAADAGPAPNEEAVRAALVYIDELRQSGVTEEWLAADGCLTKHLDRLSRSQIECAARILAAEVRRLRGFPSTDQNSTVSIHEP